MTKTASDQVCLGHWNLGIGNYLEFVICDLEFKNV